MDVKKEFLERVEEINSYLDLLDALEREARGGFPEIGGSKITPQQQRILYSSVYLQLYNLTEATVSWCLRAISLASSNDGTLTPEHLSDDMLREWVKTKARTSVPLNAANRLSEMILFSKMLLGGQSLTEWEVSVGGGGNWDDLAIEDLARRIGLELQLSTVAKTAVKKVVRDDHGALVLVKKLRNKLAHGSISFTECGTGVVPSELREMSENITSYLTEVVDLFVGYVNNREFLNEDSRATAGDAS